MQVYRLCITQAESSYAGRAGQPGMINQQCGHEGQLDHGLQKQEQSQCDNYFLLCVPHLQLHLQYSVWFCVHSIRCSHLM